jgi:ATP-dependent RNA helicase DDX55/SPB4
MGFEKMTPVQAATIPQFLGNRDVIVEVNIILSELL